MKNSRNLVWSTVCTVLMLGLVSITPAAAQDANQSTALTFNGPVALPGLTLAAGRYMFALADTKSQGDRMVIRDTNDRFIATVAVTSIRRGKAGPTAVSFRTPSSVPPQIGTLFFAGSVVGFEFTYPELAPAAAEARATTATASRR